MVVDAAARGEGLAAPVDVARLEAMQRDVVRRLDGEAPSREATGEPEIDLPQPHFAGALNEMQGDITRELVVPRGNEEPVAPFMLPSHAAEALEDLLAAMIAGVTTMRRGLAVAGARMTPEGRAVMAGLDAFLGALGLVEIETTMTAAEEAGGEGE